MLFALGFKNKLAQLRYVQNAKAEAFALGNAGFFKTREDARYRLPRCANARSKIYAKRHWREKRLSVLFSSQDYKTQQLGMNAARNVKRTMFVHTVCETADLRGKLPHNGKGEIGMLT